MRDGRALLPCRWQEAADAFEHANEKDPMNVGVLFTGLHAGSGLPVAVR